MKRKQESLAEEQGRKINVRGSATNGKNLGSLSLLQRIQLAETLLKPISFDKEGETVDHISPVLEKLGITGPVDSPSLVWELTETLNDNSKIEAKTRRRIEKLSQLLEDRGRQYQAVLEESNIAKETPDTRPASETNGTASPTVQSIEATDYIKKHGTDN